jgi:hypothetical protein
LIGIVQFGVIVLQTGCSQGVVTPTEGGGSVMSARGDWNDLEASVQLGAGQAEMAVVSRLTAEDDPRANDVVSWELVAVTDEPVRVTIRRGSGDQLTLEAQVGRFGNAAREKDLLRAVARRLEQLRGVEWAPAE